MNVRNSQGFFNARHGARMIQVACLSKRVNRNQRAMTKRMNMRATMIRSATIDDDQSRRTPAK
jgi:hypothetical protein